MKESGGASPHLCVSIVVYNSSLTLLRLTLHSLCAAARQAVPEVLSGVSVTVVDNASQPIYRGQLQQLLAEFSGQPGFTVCQLNLTTNLGYGGGHNRALPDVAGDYHLVLNPDVELAEDALTVGVARLQSDSRVALLSPYATGPGGEQEYLCKRYPSVLVLLLRAFAPGLGQRLLSARMADYQMSDVCTAEGEQNVPLASGCFMLARAADLHSLGGFDEGYFMYFEDFDLCLRLADRGSLLYLPSMRIVHHGGYAGRKGLAHVKLFASAGLRFFRQHGWQWI